MNNPANYSGFSFDDFSEMMKGTETTSNVSLELSVLHDFLRSGHMQLDVTEDDFSSSDNRLLIRAICDTHMASDMDEAYAADVIVYGKEHKFKDDFFDYVKIVNSITEPTTTTDPGNLQQLRMLCEEPLAHRISLLHKLTAKRCRVRAVSKYQKEILEGVNEEQTRTSLNAELKRISGLYEKKTVNREEALERLGKHKFNTASGAAKRIWYMQYNDIPFMSKGGIEVISAQYGQGKSQFLMALLGCLISHQNIAGMHPTIASDDIIKQGIVYLDTEMDNTDLVDDFSRMFKTIGLPENTSLDDVGVTLLTSRTSDPSERYQLFLDSQELHPAVIIIDGLADLLENPDCDAQGAGHLVQDLINIADQGVTIITVIHSQRGAGATGMRGWIGNYAEKKSNDCFQVKFDKKENTFVVDALKNRGHAPLPSIMFRIEGGIYTAYNKTDANYHNSSVENQNKLHKVVTDVLLNKKLSYTKFVEMLRQGMEEAGIPHSSASTAKRRIKELQDEGFVTYDTKGNVYFMSDKK